MSITRLIDKTTEGILKDSQFAYDYVIYTDGTYVYAFNTKTKAIERTGTPEDVFNYVGNILNQNGGSVFVSGKITDGQKAVYTFTTQGIYINTHKKVEWLSDGAILQHNINVKNAQGQVGDLVTRNNLFYLDVSGYTDCQITIKGFVIQDIRTPPLASLNPNLKDPEVINRIIAVQWGIDLSTQTYNGRRIVIENNIFIEPIGASVLWTSPIAQFIEFRNNLIIGRVGDCVHFDYASDYVVEGNIIFNTVQLDASWGYNYPAGIFAWQSDSDIDKYQSANIVIKRNKLYNCIIVLYNPVGVLVEGNYIIWLPNAINQSNPLPNVNLMPSISIYRTANTAKNYLNTQIINNYIICLITQYWRPTGIRIHGHGTSNDITIAYNTIINVYYNIFFFFDVTSNNDENGEVFSRVRIIGNKIYGGNANLIGILDFSGSTTNKIRNVEIADNIISSFLASFGFIQLRGNFENLIIRNNICWDFGSYTTYTYLLVNHDGGSMKNAVIEGNIFNPKSPIDPNNQIIKITNPTAGTIKAINNINYNPQPISSITVGASPFVYQNTDFYPEDIIISGGAVSKIEWSRDGSTYYDLGITAGKVRLEVGEYLRVTYTTAPTMTKIPL